VYAGVRRPESSAPGLVPIRLDLTDRESIAEAAQVASDVSLVINNAGISTGSSLLGDESGLRQEPEVNYLERALPRLGRRRPRRRRQAPQQVRRSVQLILDGMTLRRSRNYVAVH